MVNPGRRRAQRRADARLWRVLDELPVVCLVSDGEGCISAWSREAERLTGWSAGEVGSKDVLEHLVHPEERERAEQRVAEARATGAAVRFEARVRKRDGSDGWAVFSVAPSRDRADALVIAALDISDRVHETLAARARLEDLTVSYARLSCLARTDGLTGIANHRSFQEELARALREALSGERPLALIMADLDHFKRVNDTFGHLVGDEVLRRFAALLQAGVRAGDLVARYGGEEFALVLPGTSGEDAVALAERLRAQIHAATWPCGRLTVSFGLAVADATVLNAKDLVERADRALYAAKAGGRDRVVRWDGLDEAPSTRLDLEAWLGLIEVARVDSTGGARRRIVEQAIVDHLQWKNRLRAMVEGRDALPEEEVADHHGCRLGRWYDAAVGQHEGSATFRAVAEPHAALHRHARKLVESMRAGDRDAASLHATQVEACSVRILAALERLTEELQE